MTDLPVYLAPTFAERKTAREKVAKAAPVDAKQVDDAADDVEDKAVQSASTKKRAAKKKS